MRHQSGGEGYIRVPLRGFQRSRTTIRIRTSKPRWRCEPRHPRGASGGCSADLCFGARAGRLREALGRRGRHAGADRRRAVCAASRVYFATSPNGTASRPALRSGSSISRPSAAGTASISRIFSCGRRSAARHRQGADGAAGEALRRRGPCARFEWAVLDWNAPSIAFYRSIGAQVMDDWRICRLSGQGLADFAGEGTHR